MEDAENEDSSDADGFKPDEEQLISEEIEDEEEIEQIVEAVLFSSSHPLTVPEIEEAVGKPRSEVRQGVKKLRRMYQNRKTALEITKIGRKFSLQLKPEFNKYGMEMMDEEINKPLLKTAALIAYYQPIRQSELKKMVGEKAYDHVDSLEDKGLILSEKDGRTYSLRTSSKFQEYFGLEARDREELKKLMAKKVGIGDEES
ncbi:MAG: SMC-Scp complex subunit ScpB [Candidatus Thermoplasmatota archaeon]|nr:SMC-Scp complex subunit ScpB [Candidatus Thermoplasmatota archaeon]MBS3789702.1 SMC-Scp complex subunit ScpB [Candidatus Thermoplasmatota archaeon]